MLLALVVAILLQLLLITTIPVNIYPEQFVYPWLVLKGLLPYRDFFDHHGFLTYYLLAPFVADKSLHTLIVFFYATQVISLILFFFIIKGRTKSRIIIFLSATLFILVNFFITDNNIWYEIFINIFFLVIYWEKVNLKVRSLFIGLSVLIKPTILIFLGFFSILEIRKIKQIILYTILPVIASLIFFFLKGSLKWIANDIIIFNFSFVNSVGINTILDKRFLFYIFVLFIIGEIILFKRNKKLFKYNLAFILTSLFLFPPKYAKAHAIPFATFSTLTFIEGVLELSKKLSAIILFTSIMLILLPVKHQYFVLKKRISYQEKIRKEALVITKRIKNKNQLYVYGNMPGIYYFLDILPVTKYLLVFPFAPWINKTYMEIIQDNIVNSLKTKNMKVVVELENRDYAFPYFSKVDKLIRDKYKKKGKDKFLIIYIRK